MKDGTIKDGAMHRINKSTDFIDSKEVNQRSVG